MTIESPNNMPYIPNSGCSTFEVNQKMMDDTYAALKKVDETVDKFIKTEEGKAKKEKIKKNLAIGILGAVGIATTAVVLAKSGKPNKIIEPIKSFFILHIQHSFQILSLNFRYLAYNIDIVFLNCLF